MSIKLRQSFWSLCKLGKGRSCYWVAYWGGSPLDDPSREPDAKGKATSETTAEAAAREAIRAGQVDWRFQTVRTLDRFAETQATIDGLKVFNPPNRWAKMRADEKARFAERDRIDASSRAYRAEADARFNALWESLKGEREARQAAAQKKMRDAFNAAFGAPVDPSLAAFTLLGVPPSASVDDIKRAFRTKSFNAHPDRGGSHEEFCALNDAWRVATKAAADGFTTTRVYI